MIMPYLAEYKTFNNVDELNHSVSEHFKRCKFELTKSAQAVLTMISQHSLIYPGASHLKINTIANALKVSPKTVQRALTKLEQLDVLNRIPFMRKVRGGHGANVFVIVPATATTTDIPEKPVEIKKSTSSKFKVRKNQYINLEPSTESLTFYQKIKRALENTIGNTKDARDIFGVYRSLTLDHLNYSRRPDFVEAVEHIGLESLKITTAKTKKVKLNSIVGFFSRTLANQIAKFLYGDDNFNRHTKKQKACISDIELPF